MSLDCNAWIVQVQHLNHVVVCGQCVGDHRCQESREATDAGRQQNKAGKSALNAIMSPGQRAVQEVKSRDLRADKYKMSTNPLIGARICVTARLPCAAQSVRKRICVYVVPFPMSPRAH